MNPISRTSTRAGRLWSAVGWTLMLVGALGAAANAVTFLWIESYGHPDIKARFLGTALAGFAHALGGAVAVVLGPLQFLSIIRRRAPRVHVWIGRTYLGAVLAGALGGLYFAPTSVAGPAGTVGFTCLAVFWLYSGSLAYLEIRRGHIDAHRRWMIRNYALTFAAVTLRIELPLLLMSGVVFPTALMIVSWLCWVPNWCVVEGWLRFRGARRQTVADVGLAGAPALDSRAPAEP